MKKLLILSALLAVSACQMAPAFADATLGGSLFESTTVPFATGPASSSSRYGSAECKNVLNIVQWGSCGVNDAMRSGKIRTVNHVDVNRDGCIFYKKITTRVYGE